jgi:hypothetical protein
MDWQGGDGHCTYSGTPTQRGSLADIAGTYQCNDGKSGSFDMADVDPTADGFTGSFVGDRITDASNGRIGALRGGPGNISNGWMSDLWIAPGESGWGLNLVGQGGDNMFGTLFVYDTNRRAKWYSMSDLHYIGVSDTPGNRGTYIGIIYESTGPWFGMASFDPRVVTRRRAGSVSIRFDDSQHATVSYQIDASGISEQKAMVPFAFRTNDLSGKYEGHIVSSTGSSSAAVAPPAAITITDDCTTVTIHANSARDCTYTGPRGQSGQRVFVSGTYTCTDGTGGTFAISDAEVSYRGFTAAMGTAPGAVNVTAHIGGARVGAF